MGAAASITEVEAEGFATAFDRIDLDGNGVIDRDEFKQAMKVVGIEDKTMVDDVFLKFDVDNSGSISGDEFVRYCVSEARKRSLQGPKIKNARTLVFSDFLSPSEAQHGFSMAHRLLQANPQACRAPLLNLAAPKGSSPWLPLHYLLARLPRGTGRETSIAAAEPLILRILELHPAQASARVMEGVRFQLGNLPLEFAVTRGWPEAVVKAVVKANPAATTSLDPLRMKKKFDKAAWNPTSSKGCRYMRKIAMDAYAAAAEGPPPAELLRLLPKPSKPGLPLEWKDGKKVEEEELEKARLKAERLAKKAAALAKKQMLREAKAAKLAAKAVAAKESEARKAEAGRSAMSRARSALGGDDETLATIATRDTRATVGTTLTVASTATLSFAAVAHAADGAGAGGGRGRASGAGLEQFMARVVEDTAEADGAEAKAAVSKTAGATAINAKAAGAGKAETKTEVKSPVAGGPPQNPMPVPGESRPGAMPRTMTGKPQPHEKAASKGKGKLGAR